MLLIEFLYYLLLTFIGVVFLIVLFRVFIGPSAPHPSGDESKELRILMLRATKTRWFVFKLSAWSALPWRKTFRRHKFDKCLEKAVFHEFRTRWEALRSIGWSGHNPDSD